MKKKNSGVIFILLSAFLFSFGGVCNKLLPWSAFAINGARCLVGLIPLGIYMAAKKHRVKFNLTVLLGSVCFLGATALLMLSTKFTSSANAIVLQYTAPVFIILYHLIFRRQKPKKMDILTCAAVFIGIIFFFVEGMSKGTFFGNAMGLLSGISYAGVCMLNTFEKGDSLSSIFFGMILCVITGIPFLFRETDFSANTLLIAGFMGIFQMGLGYTCFNLGLKSAHPVSVSLISGIEPILNPLFVALFYRDDLGVLSVIGALIVLAAVLWYNAAMARQPQET